MANTSNLSLVDKLIDDQGVKFSVNLDVSPDIYAKLFLVITLSVVVSVTAMTLIQNAIKS